MNHYSALRCKMRQKFEGEANSKFRKSDYEFLTNVSLAYPEPVSEQLGVYMTLGFPKL